MFIILLDHKRIDPLFEFANLCLNIVDVLSVSLVLSLQEQLGVVVDFFVTELLNNLTLSSHFLISKPLLDAGDDTWDSIPIIE
jgi:hypothetical protein